MNRPDLPGGFEIGPLVAGEHEIRCDEEEHRAVAQVEANGFGGEAVRVAGDLDRSG